LVLESRHRRVGARGRHAKLRWRLLDPVAVAGPHGYAPLRLESGEQAGRVTYRDLRPAVLAFRGRRHLAAREMGHELHAVADGEDGRPELEELGIGRRRARVEHRVGAAGENDALGGELLDEAQLGAACGRMDLTVDVRLAYPARDELRELRAVVEDQNPVHAPPARYQVVGSSTSPRSRSSSVSRC